MVPTTETTRVYLNENRQGVVTCVHCDVKRAINMSNYTDHYLRRQSLKVKCSTCHKIVHIKFDRRKYYRIKVNIHGEFFYFQSGKDIDNITVISLSLGGIGYVISDELSIKSDEIYRIKFKLRDEYSSVPCEE